MEWKLPPEPWKTTMDRQEAGDDTAARQPRINEADRSQVDPNPKNIDDLIPHDHPARLVWELLQERTNLTEDDLMAKVRDIDLRDGVADGKLQTDKSLAKCSNCGRTMSDRHGRCLYCGGANLEAVSWDSGI